ncbi:hypothetical protein IX56_17620 [Paracoccus sanguinis]|uniref:Uncharacterized protein n=1 Tax=Paracoccus sanguinis TaxID=1545044 RepID=A0A099G3Q7_9RHOB|nr:hypothetical protein IX56_17620 [Paracoccus sanguinis]
MIGGLFATIVTIDIEGPKVADTFGSINRALAKRAGAGKLLVDQVREMAVMKKVMIDWGPALPPLLKRAVSPTKQALPRLVDGVEE